MTPERRIRTLQLTAPEERWIGRGAFLVEDALRTASLPWADAGRLLLIRAVDLGTIPAGAAPASVALALERRLRELARTAVHAAQPAAPQAAAVWFRDAAEAHALLAERLVAGAAPAAWYWPLAVPTWRPGTSRDAALRALLLGALETPAGPAAALELVRALWEAGGVDLLASVLVPADGPWLLRACGWRLPGPGDALPEVRGPRALALARWAEHWGIADARTVWLARALKMVARDANAGLASPAFGRLEPVRVPAVGPRPPAPSPIAPPSPGRGGEPSPPAPLPRAGEGWRLPKDRSGISSSTPPNPHPSPTRGRGAGGEGPRAAAPTAASPAPPPNEGRGADVSIPPPLPPQCRDAPWGVSEAAPPFQEPGPVDGHPMSSDRAVDSDGGVDTARPIGRLADGAVGAAAETPHGASLHWGGDGGGMEALAPLPDSSGAPSPHAGLFFLLPVLDHVGLPAFLEDHPHLLDAGFPARFLDHMAERLGAPADDPIRRALLVPEEAMEDEEALLRTWRIAVRRWCRLRARIGVADLIRRPGRVIATRTHVDVFFDPRQVEMRVRCAGLDLDPGWVPWLGRVVLFHYEQPPEVLDVG